jgi:hypothetical protein
MEIPVKIVTVNHLNSWSDTLAARADIPGIIASLIRATCPSLQSYRFPSGDASQAHGFDGVAEVLEARPFVPSGQSIWEFGTGKDFERKANSDYAKRTKELTPAERSMRTFTFVTTRLWDTGLDDWKRARSSDGWKSVEVLDASAPESWLAECPAVALPLARTLHIILPDGVRTIQEFWEEYSLNFAPTLTVELLLNGRKERAKRLCEGLAAGLPSLSKWRADSPTEALAFICSAILSADAELSAFLCSKTLILETKAAAQIVPRKNGFNFILPPDVSQVGAALATTNHVILVLGTDDRADGCDAIELMNTIDFAAGLKSMGFEEGEAFRWAGMCGRSVTVLSRLKASARAIPPRWHDNPKLVPLMLAGGWNASNEHDRAVVAKISNTAYENVDSEVRRLAALPDSPFDLEGSIWTLRSHKDAFTLLAYLVDSGCQQRLVEACIDVFAESDRELDIPQEQRPPVPTRGADFRHSEWLRRGLARTLLLISGLHEAAGFKVIGQDPVDYVENVVSSIPRLAEDVRVLASLKHEFPRLAEAAPRPLARSLERVLGGDNKNWVRVIFRDKQDQSLWAASSPHTYFLWALETMAWNPAYLHQAASILMILAESDPGGRLSNRPLESLREIFLAWRPNTYASTEERIAVLRSICRVSPRVGLELAMSLLPKSHDHSGGTAKPRMRDFGEANSKPTTIADVQYAYRQYAEIAVEVAGNDISRLREIVDNLPQLDETTRARAITQIEKSARVAEPDDVFQLWSRLHDLVLRHQTFRDAAWAMRTDQLKPLEELCQAIQPTNPVLRIVWLFNEYAPKTGVPKGEGYIEDANHDRSEAVRELLREHGPSAVLELAKKVRLPHFAGIAVVDATRSMDVIQEITARAVAPDSGVSEDFAIGLSAAAHELHGVAWDNWLERFARGLQPGPAANLLLRWRDSAKTWEFAASLSPAIEKEYWKRKWAFRPTTPQEVSYAFEKYAEVERFSAILDMIAYDESVLSTRQCIQVLEGLIHEVDNEPKKLQHVHYEVAHMIEALQKRADVDIEELGAIEYKFLPILEFQAEPVALNRLLGTSPELFVSVICDAFAPASGERGEITHERRQRARLAYSLLQSMKTVPGFSAGVGDVTHLRAWLSEARRMSKDADRAIIADQQIGQVLAYAPFDAEDGAWPAKSIRDVIEDVADDQIELGIAISRFNQRGAFTKSLFDGGAQERGIAEQYREWSQAARGWPRTSSLLRRIAEDWDRHAKRADSEAELDQLRDGG